MSQRPALKLLPMPRSLKILRGHFTLRKEAADLILGNARASRAGFGTLAEYNVEQIKLMKIAANEASAATREGVCAPRNEFYSLTISKNGIEISFREPAGLPAASATLRQLLRQHGRRLPCLKIRDWPDFSRRGVMLDISRGRVPKLETLLDLAERLSDFKINELQLYTEHTFAYRNYKSVWQSWGALTGQEIHKLDARCRELGIDLVPNQNSFGHLRYFLEHPQLKQLAEVFEPYEGGSDASSLTNERGDEGVAATSSSNFLRRPSTLAPNHHGTLPFLRKLYGELLPNYSSQFFNVGFDETWDLGHGQSKILCEQRGKGRVYLDFLKQIHREVSKRGKRMMFWGDIILKYPKLIPELAKLGRDALPRVWADQQVSPTINVIALNWGYEANHPFEKEAMQFAKAKIPFYVCPGTSTWQTLIGKHDNALTNLRAAAKAGCKHGAIGYLITDWGDGGHPQPLAVSWPMFLAGASLAWNTKAFDESKLVSVLSRDVFEDSSGRIAAAAFKLGFAHQKLGVKAPNETPLGTVIAAPKSEERELFCRNGLKWFARIPAEKIRATLKEIQKQREALKSVRDAEHRLGRNEGKLSKRRGGARRSALELDLAARMAAQSCQFMLWQQTVAAGNISEAKRLARTGFSDLKQLEKDFNALWPSRNKATPKHCSAFLRWRMDDYRSGSAA